MEPSFRHSGSDIALIVGCLIILTVGIFHMVSNRAKYNSYKANINLIMAGIFFLLISILGKCLDASRCDKDFIIAFLSLVSIEDGVIDRYGFFFSFFTVAAYGLFAVGLTRLILAKINRVRGKYKPTNKSE